MRRQAHNLLLHLFQNRNALRVVQTSDHTQGQVEVGHEAQGIIRLRTMNLIQLVIVTLEDGFGMEKALLESHLTLRYVRDANVGEDSNKLLVAHIFK